MTKRRRRRVVPLLSLEGLVVLALGILLFPIGGGPEMGPLHSLLVQAAAAGSPLENATDAQGRYLIPYGTPIPDEKLDGFIDEEEEWADANRIAVTLVEEESGRSYTAQLRIKHNGEYLYVGIDTPMRPAVAFWFLFYLDKNGNGSVFDPGDDVLRVPSKRFHKIPESKSAEDQYVVGMQGRRPRLERDTASGGERNLLGKGREQRASGGVTYTAEARHPLNSGDEWDVAWVPGEETVYLYLEGIWPVPAEGVAPDIYEGGTPRQAAPFVLVPPEG